MIGDDPGWKKSSVRQRARRSAIRSRRLALVVIQSAEAADEVYHPIRIQERSALTALHVVDAPAPAEASC
jgi:hypothetical protein